MIAERLSIDPALSIPLSISFQRPGIVFRSAVFLRKKPPLTSRHSDLQQQLQKAFSEASTSFPDSFCFHVTSTDKGWLEFSLDGGSLGRWLQDCHDHWNNKASQMIALFEQDPELAFRWQYLHQRCQSLLRLASNLDAMGKPRWQFTGYTIPSWEQDLLDGTTRYLLATLDNDPKGDRHLRTIEKAFWEFHRHCALFSFYPSQPERFWHYCAWLQLMLAIAQQT